MKENYMKKTSALVASVIAAGSVFAAIPASQAASVATATVDYTNGANTTTALSNLKYGDTITLNMVSATAVGLYASVCKAGATQMEIPAPCDPDMSHMTYIAPNTSGSGTIKVLTAFGAGLTAVNCLTDQCVIYIRGSHDNANNYALIRAIPFTAVAATASVTATLPAASKFKVGKTVAVAASAVRSNVGATVTLSSTTTKVCTVKKTSTGWSIKAIKAGTCTVKATTAAEAHGAYTSATASKSVIVKK